MWRTGPSGGNNWQHNVISLLLSSHWQTVQTPHKNIENRLKRIFFLLLPTYPEYKRLDYTVYNVKAGYTVQNCVKIFYLTWLHSCNITCNIWCNVWWATFGSVVKLECEIWLDEHWNLIHYCMQCYRLWIHKEICCMQCCKSRKKFYCCNIVAKMAVWNTF